MNRPAGFIELLVRHANGTANAGDFVKWADAALTAGWDSPSLRRLAGFEDARVDEASALFDRSSDELGLDRPTGNAALRREHLRAIAEGIVDGTRDPLAAVDQIHREVISPLEHPKDLMAWCLLSEGNDPRTYGTIADEKIAQLARELARDTLNNAAEGWRPPVIFAVGEDGSITVHASEEDARREWEPIDVESGAVVFYDDDGTWLKPDFVKPNQRWLFGLIVTEGKYKLVRSATPPEIDPIDLALSEAIGLKPNTNFASIDAIARHIRYRRSR